MNKKMAQLLDKELSSEAPSVDPQLVKAQLTSNRLKAMELAKGMTKDQIQEMKDNADLLLQ